jgi:phage portal protein BeeE
VSLFDRLVWDRAKVAQGRKEFAQPPFWAYDGLSWPFLSTTPLYGDKEKIEADFEGYVQGAYKANGIIFAAIAARQRVYSQARFQWREFRNGQPGDLFGSNELSLLEQPWPNGTTGELLSRMEVTASLAGNYYATVADDRGRVGRTAMGSASRRIVHMRPDWTTIIIDSASGNPNALDARAVGYLYEPPAVGGGFPTPDPLVLLPSEVCHYSPIPDPVAKFRGMSWLTPIIEEIRADKLATIHKARIFQNGAMPSLAIVFDKDTQPEAFDAFVAKFKASHQGADKAGKTLFLAGGADPRPLTVDFRGLEFSTTQGAGETRIASAAGVPAAILGIAKGLEGSSLNAGNYTAAKRSFAEMTLADLWSKTAASLSSLVTPPRAGAALWYDDRNIPFLQENADDRAAIRERNAMALRQLVDGGFDPDAAVAYLQTNDLSRLTGQHTGLLPVQLQPPGSGEDRAAAANGNGRASGQQAAAARRG